MPIPDTVVDFFSRNLSAPGRRKGVLVACSGGPDSVALAAAAAEAASGLGIRLGLAHVNHRLRGRRSDGDETFVKTLGRRLNIPVFVRRRPIRGRQGNLEERARVLRYDALGAMAVRGGYAGVATAHTRDDQAETIVLNISRGTGLTGLGGMRSRRPMGDWILFRPFLTVARADVERFLRHGRLAVRDDASNRDLAFNRNWVRHDLLRRWERRYPGLKGRLARMADLLADEAKAADWAVERAVAEFAARGPRGWTIDFRRLRAAPPGVQRWVLRRLAGGDLLTSDGVERLRRWMDAAPTQGRFFDIRKGWKAERMSRSRGAPSAQLFLIRPGPSGRGRSGFRPIRRAQSSKRNQPLV